MTLDPANNLAETELTASVSDTATTLPVADASVFPDADSEGAFNVLVWDASANINPSDAPDAEFVRVTGVDTTADELTVERGQEDTPASAKESGSTVADTWSVKDRDDIDSALNAKADDPHGNEAHTSTFAVDGDAQPPEEHGNAAHTETYAVDGDAQPPETHGDTEHDDTVPSQSDVDSKADDPHDNAAHSETFAVDGDAQPPEEHDNAAHTETFAVDGDEQPPEEHGNAAHTETFAVDGDPQPPETHDNTAHSEAYTTTAENVENFATAGAAGEVPTSQGDGTLAMESAADGAIALEEYATAEDVPPPSEVTQPTIAYVADVGDGTDDYIGVFES